MFQITANSSTQEAIEKLRKIKEKFNQDMGRTKPKKTCTCSIRNLMIAGCKCGGS